MMREYFLPLLTNVGVIQSLKHDEAVATARHPEYCAHAPIGDRLAGDGGRENRRMYDEVGGFGSLLLFCFDYSDNQGLGSIRWAVPREVMPRWPTCRALDRKCWVLARQDHQSFDA